MTVTELLVVGAISGGVIGYCVRRILGPWPIVAATLAAVALALLIAFQIESESPGAIAAILNGAPPHPALRFFAFPIATAALVALSTARGRSDQ